MSKYKSALNLANLCRRESEVHVKKFLNDHPSDLNLAEENGVVISQALTGKSINIVKMLLNYYEQSISNLDHDSLEHKVMNYKFRDIIEETVSSYDVLPEIKALLLEKELIGTGEDTDTQDSLSDLDALETNSEFSEYTSDFEDFNNFSVDSNLLGISE